MTNTKVWTFIALGLVLGVSFELMKSSAPDGDRLRRLARLENLMDEGRPVYQPSLMQTIRQHLPRLNVISKIISAPSNENVATEVKKTPPTVVAKVDPKKKEADKKKNKKTKKIDPTKPEDAQEHVAEVAKPEDKTDAAGDGSTLSPGAAGFPGAANTKDPNAIPKTVKEWEDFLLNDPSYDKTTKFIRYYQNNEFEAAVFYPVVEAMTTDERDQLHQYGVMALGSTPSIVSFTMLSTIMAGEQGVTKLKSQIQVYLTMYTRLEYVRLLGSTLSVSNNAATNTEALRLIQISADMHLKVITTQAADGSTTRVPAGSSMIAYFNSLISVVHQVSVSANNETVRQQALGTLSNLQNLIASQTST